MLSTLGYVAPDIALSMDLTKPSIPMESFLNQYNSIIYEKDEFTLTMSHHVRSISCELFYTSPEYTNY
jgi:hypothetical protein